MTTVRRKPSTLLHHPLSSPQYAIANYLLPAVVTSLIYILHFAADACLALQHLWDDNQIYGTITILWVFSPVVGSLLFTLSNVEAWPEVEGFRKENSKWLFVKILQHAGFPIWAMYRFAEQLFWSIEAVRNKDEQEIKECLTKAERNSIFELYHFLQAYLQAAPQILFQLHLIFRQSSNFNKTTVDMQVLSMVLSLIKMSMTTMSYQRFKSQKPVGRKYPWTKESKPVHLNTIQETYRYSSPLAAIPATIPEEEEHLTDENESIQEENSDTEVDQEHGAVKLSRKSSGLSITSSQFDVKIEKKSDQTDFIDTKVEKKSDQTDLILPVKIIFYRGLPEDDAAGKLVSFFWWFCFILPRMLALSAFAYFYRTEIWWLCGSHYIICLGFLLYDAHTEDIPYYRAVFILFTAFVYMFCLIEFKIKFKKIRFIYIGYFTLVYLENFIMTSIWYNGEEFIYSDWWYRYIYYLILGSSIISAVSMFFYLFILKPKKITTNTGYRSSKIL